VFYELVYKFVKQNDTLVHMICEILSPTWMGTRV
jgi:hypothetical protein